MKVLFLLLLAQAHGNPPPPATVQWSLRFNELRPHPAAMTGCYGTASYEYVLPSVKTLKEHREPLLKKAKEAKLSGFAFSRENSLKDPAHALVVDLKNGDVRSIPRYLGFGANKGIVFCQCRTTPLKNCSRSGVPVLGQPFFTTAEIPATN